MEKKQASRHDQIEASLTEYPRRAHSVHGPVVREMYLDWLVDQIVLYETKAKREVDPYTLQALSIAFNFIQARIITDGDPIFNFQGLLTELEQV